MTPEPYLVWDRGAPAAAQFVMSVCRTVDYWSPRGRTCLVELDNLTSRQSKSKGYGDTIMAAIDLLAKRKIVTYEAGVVTVPLIFKPSIQGKLTRNRPPE